MLNIKFKFVGFIIWGICLGFGGALLASFGIYSSNQYVLAETQTGSQTETQIGRNLDDINANAAVGQLSQQDNGDNVGDTAADTSLTDANPEAPTNPNTQVPAETETITTNKPEATDKTAGWPEVLGYLRSKEITLNSPRLTINLPDKGGVARITVTSGETSAPFDGMLNKLAFKKINLKNGTFVFRTPSGFTQTIYAVDATIAGDKNSKITTAKGRFKFRGEEINFEVTATKPSDDEKGGILPVSVRLNGAKLNAELIGNLNLSEGPSIEGKLKLAMTDLKFISSWLGYPISGENKTTQLNADGAFIWRGSVLSFIDANFNIAGSEATGAMSVDLAGSRPRVDATMAFDQINLTKFKKSRRNARFKSGSLNSSSEIVNDNGSIEEHVLELDYLNEFDADLRISAEQVQLGKLVADSCAITMTLKSGDLLIGLVESKVAEGMLHGEFSLKKGLDGPVSNLRADFESVKTKTLAAALDMPGLIEGVANIKLDISGQGTNLLALKKSMSGELKFRSDGPIRLSTASKNITHSTASLNALNWWLNIAGETTFIDFENDFKITKGVITTGSLKFGNSDFNLKGFGEIDIVGKKAEVFLRRFRVDENGVVDKAGFDDGSTDTVIVRGPWKKLILAPDESGANPIKDNVDNTIPGKQGTGSGHHSETADTLDRG